MIKISARLFDLPDERAMARKLGLEKGGRVQRYIDQTVIDFCQPYVPASPDRTLEHSAQLATEIGSGMVVWNTPYAHYQYEGIVYGPSIPEIDPETGVLLGFWSPPGRPKHPTHTHRRPSEAGRRQRRAGIRRMRAGWSRLQNVAVARLLNKKLTYDKAQNPMSGARLSPLELIGQFRPKAKPADPSGTAASWPHWVERMKADRMAELLEGAQRVMERGE